MAVWLLTTYNLKTDDDELILPIHETGVSYHYHIPTHSKDAIRIMFFVNQYTLYSCPINNRLKSLNVAVKQYPLPPLNFTFGHFNTQTLL